MKFFSTAILFFMGLFALQGEDNNKEPSKLQKTQEVPASSDSEKIKVLNFGTFHMGSTTDSFGVAFDPITEKPAVHEIARQIAAFRPTVIVVERPPENDKKLQAEYSQYLKNPEMDFDYVSEVQLLAYEIGRICSTKRILGIDHKMNYNYAIGATIDNSIDPATCNKFVQEIPKILSKQNGLSTLEKLQLYNSKEALDFAMLANADILSYMGTEENFEGADEAAKFYKRNLRMYSNLNRIKLAKEDRVFILLGATHTAFLNDFLGRSPKYELVDPLKYLKQ